MGRGRETDRRPSASNSTYFAFVEGRGVHISCLDPQRQDWRSVIDLPGALNPGLTVLAFSHCHSNKLAVFAGGKTAIYDVETQMLLQTLQNVGRAVTAAAWSCSLHNFLAIGHIDGRIVIWNTEDTRYPRHTLSLARAPCHRLSWNVSGRAMLAASSGNEAHVWELGATVRRFLGRRQLQQNIEHLVWSTQSDFILNTVDHSGKLSRWDLVDASSVVEANEYDSIFGGLEDKDAEVEPVAQYDWQTPVRSALFLDHCVFATFNTSAANNIQLFDLSPPDIHPNSLWQSNMIVSAKHLSLQRAADTSFIRAVGVEGVHYEQLSPEAVTALELNKLSGTAMSLDKDPCYQENVQEAPSGMKPVTIASMKADRVTFARTALQLQSRRSRKSASPPVRPMTGVSEPSTVTTMLAASPQVSMASSLELPNPGDEEDSPMPFLSPSIPARKPSPMALSPIDDILCLPPPSSQKQLLATSTTERQESDSDDETFDDNGMQGSGTLMPGRTNVPLPRSCGALFAPNGQLVTFLRPRLRPLSPEGGAAPPGEHQHRATKATTIFSTFGNLAGQRLLWDRDTSDSESDSTGSWTALNVPDIGLQPPSFQSTEPLHFRAESVVRPLFLDSANQKAVTVHVYHLDQTSLAQPAVALEYRVPGSVDANEIELCHCNAEIAQANGSQDIAAIWLQAARLIEEYTRCGVQDSTSMPRRGPFTGSSALDGVNIEKELRDRLGKEHRTFGSQWVVEQIFEWAETRSNIPVLASLSAIFIVASHNLQSQKAEVTARQARVLPGQGSSGRDAHRRSTTDTKGSNPIPILRNDFFDGNKLRESPVKLAFGSEAPSRTPSQPTTPYLDSLSSTPPYLFPDLSRQGSHLSTSGSASPEYHRSSFSAAAKYYAQSITDKFSSYGTSPPIKRLAMSTSPGNELPSSLPAAGGSWAKSVSFASKAETVGSGRHSKTAILPEDENDSDRTIEDLSQPQTPRSDSGSMAFKFKRAEEVKNIDDHPRHECIMSAPLLSKAHIWIHYYAEQLRCINKVAAAAEIENIAATHESSRHEAPTISTSGGMLPIPANGNQRTTCGICECAIHGLQHFCPSCCHTTHISCLESFIESCGVDQFECPTGCGCVCSSVPQEEVMWEEEDPVQKNAAKLQKKGSFTDPRRWRARIEGDSW